MNLANFILLFAQSQLEKNPTPDYEMWGRILMSIGYGIYASTFFYQLFIRKSIEITKVSSAPLVKIDEKINHEYADNLEIFFKGEKIEDATYIVLRIVNSGFQAITKNDFKDCIAIMFNYNTEILKAGILKTEPIGIKPIIEIEKNNIVLNPLLINPKDTIEISAIVSSFDGKIDIAGRIKNIKDIKIGDENSKNNKFLWGLSRLEIYLIGVIFILCNALFWISLAFLTF